MHNKHKCAFVLKYYTSFRYFRHVETLSRQIMLLLFFLDAHYVCFQSVYVCITQLALDAVCTLC